MKGVAFEVFEGKAKIVIDKGACVLGCMDETATLKGYFSDRIPRKDARLEEKVAGLPEIFSRYTSLKMVKSTKSLKVSASWRVTPLFTLVVFAWLGLSTLQAFIISRT
jgi:hypothetical protein